MRSVLPVNWSGSILPAFALAMVLLWMISVPAYAEDGFLRITAIDVGKGDCLLVQTGEEEDPDNVLIDTGFQETAPDVINYLKSNGISRLDAVIISHFHNDHIGGAARILKDPDIEVSAVIMPDYDASRKAFLRMMKALDHPGCAASCQRLGVYGDFQLNDAVFRLYPSSIEFDGENENDLSMAAILEYGGQTVLFTGDLEEDGIRSLLNTYDIPMVDILKLPHHGAGVINTADLLQRLKPGGIVIITDGHKKRADGTLVDAIVSAGYTYVSSADDGTVQLTYDAAGQVYDIQKSADRNVLAEGDWTYILSGDRAELEGYSGSLQSLQIPSGIGGFPVGSIARSAFYNKTFTDITVPDTVTAIGASAFSWCSELTSINLPDGLAEIDEAAFSWCSSLESIRIPDSVMKAGTSCFRNCSNLKNVELSAGMTEIPELFFARCTGLESIEIPGGIKTIGRKAFRQCTALKTVYIQTGVKNIKRKAFEGCEGLESITIPATVKALKKGAFRKCSSLAEVRFTGTKEQWAPLNRDNIAGLPAEGMGILCSDGVFSEADAEYYTARDAAGALKTKIRSVSPLKSRKVRVTWKKVRKASGCQIVCSTSARFTRKTTVRATADSETARTTISGLKAGRTYYVKVRPYTWVFDPSSETNVKVYGNYSAVRTFRAKR